MQTPREVIDCLLRKRPAERVGLHDSAWPDTLERWVTQGFPTNEKGEPVESVDHFGYDMVGCGGGVDMQPRRGVDEIVEETDEWKIVRNGSGAALKWWKHKSGVPEHIDFRMSSREVWERDYRSHLLEVDRERLDLKGTAKALAERKAEGLWTFFGTAFIWECMRASMGDYNMYMALVADPDWIHDYNRVYTDFCKAHYRILFDEAGLPDGVWVYEDLGYKHRTFCSPETLEEVIIPYYTELVEFFHSYDLPVILHTCGYTESLLDLIVAAGFDGLHPMEVKAGNDLLKFAEQYGDQFAFIGGLDVRVLESGDRDLIRRRVIDLVEGMKARGAAYVFGSDHSLSTNVDYPDFNYAIEVYRDQMMY